MNTTRFSALTYVCVCVCACLLSHVRLFATPWTVAHQAPLSMGFSRQEYWSGLPCPPGDFPDPGIEPASPALQMDFFFPVRHLGSLISYITFLSVLAWKIPLTEEPSGLQSMELQRVGHD